MKNKVLNKVENIEAKREIAHYINNFLLLQQCVQKLSAAEASESVCMWEGVTEINVRLYKYVSLITHTEGAES